MDKNQMEEFFRMVGFTPPEQGAGSSDARGASDAASESERGTHQRNPFAGRGRRGGDGGDGGGGGSILDSFIPDIPLPAWGKKTIIIAAIALVLIVAFAYWWFHPPINIHSADLWWFLIIFVLLPSFVTFRSLSHAYAKGSDKRAQSDGKAKRFKWLSFIPLAVFAIAVVGWAASYSIWPGNAEKYSSILKIQNLDFATDIKEPDFGTVPVIDRESATLLGNRTLGEIPEYVSQFEIETTYSQINYKGRPVRVSPLGYADFFKWFYNMDTGVPAYVLVDMATQNTQIVRPEQPMYYVESDPFVRNIDRYVQLSYPFYMFEEKAFEIDEDGTPWWVCPVQNRTIGLFGGEDIERVVLVNASTGECQDMPIEDCPEWVDRAYPSDLVVQQYNWYGSLHNGWLNSWLGQSGVVQTTPGTNGKRGYNYIAKDDDVWVYTGVTSATSDNAIVGFILVNQRTAEAHYYSVAGATEDSAMRSAEGQVQNLEYKATFPLLLNINGQPTYFIALKDAAGLVKKFAMIDIQRYQNVAVGDTIDQCQKTYKALLATNGISSDSAGDMTLLSKEGTVRTVMQAAIEGNSHIYLTLTGDTLIYDCPLPTVIQAVGVAQGDTVKIEYVEGDPTATVQNLEVVQSTAAAAAATTPAVQAAPGQAS
ncbi:Tat pathway signal sequence [Curtanaerobium respiraculi]|uniref:Tat pathway signal sequence n=1 Tax=Curtanaerobium respiraculi TaxID=2949669 RepID=UPI0024B36C9F|nr:Tat pathway signal sequence [Curtanaerobium respiraculi]